MARTATHVTTDRGALRSHLVRTRLAGSVATSPRSTIENCGKLARGHPDYHFGLPDWREASMLDALAAIREVCGGDPGALDPDGPGWIDPDAAVMGILTHAERIAELVASGGGRVLLATGHPTGLLGHYAAIGRALHEAGCELLTPLDDEWLTTSDRGRRLGLRFVERVGCAFDGGSLRHTHWSTFMEAMLADVDPDSIDLVIADHGMAGAAIAAGIMTLSIADVNDPGLPLAQVRGRTDGVLPIDDNLAPRVFAPVTAAMLGPGISALADLDSRLTDP
jgi:hypothetical protein